MKEYLEFCELTLDGIEQFIESAAGQNEGNPMYLLGKAAGYVDMAFALERISKKSALELHSRIDQYVDCVLVYAARAEECP